MHIIVGATGQVGSNLIAEINKKGFPVRAVVRNPGKLTGQNIDYRTADLFDVNNLAEAFDGGSAIFVLTPENPSSNDVIGDTKQIVENYFKAIKATGIKKVVGLSCVGAHVEGNTGNILMSRILEQGLEGLEAEKILVRPSYYFSNWLAYWDTAVQYGILPTFFPEDLEIEMHSPIDLAKFLAKIMTENPAAGNKTVYELTGPQRYSSRDVAKAFSKSLNREVVAHTIPREQWKETLLSAGFTEDATKNLIDMTQAVIDQKTLPERPTDIIKLPSTLDVYLEQQIKNR